MKEVNELLTVENVLKLAKEKEKKIPFNFLIPKKTRDKFKQYCKEHNLTMTDVILAFIKISLEHDKDK